MKPQQLEEYNSKIKHYIAARRVTAALGTLSQMLDTITAPWELREELQRLSSDYDYMMRYALDGASDPHRDEVYSGITNGIMDLLGRVNRYLRAATDSSLYFSTLRYENMQRSDSLQSIADAWRHDASALEMAILAGNHDASLKPLRAQFEALSRRLFNRIWVTFPLSTDDEVTITNLLSDTLLPLTERLRLVSALLLALLANYDARVLYVLLALYSNDSLEMSIRMRALTAALIAMSTHRRRKPGRRLRTLLESVREMPGWSTDVKMVSIQLIRTRDTEKINRKMRDEVIPHMMKLRPDIYKKISENPEAIDPQAIEENPEWQDMLEKSGVADRLRELQEMQEEGADVMMSTFAHLKTFPFFNDIPNWFLPFDADNTAITATESVKSISDIVAAAPFLCDSDKYSVMLSVAQMPDAQRDMIARQFDMQNANLREAAEASLDNPERRRDDEARNYIQSLYRFFKLFRRKGEMHDPFNTSLNLATVPLLSDIFNRADHLAVVAEFYFKHGYYQDAADLFSKLVELEAASLPTYQKLGYSHQQLGNLNDALESYKRAEMLAPDDLWTMRRLASCLRLTGNPAGALEYYQRIARTKPDDINAPLMAGHCLLELGRNKEALSQYFKVEYLDESSTKALRPIAWCSFLEGDYLRAADYFGRIPEDTITGADRLNMGHLDMALGDYRAAIEQYRKALELMGNDKSRFAKAMQADLLHLRAAGVEDFMTGLVLDTLL